MEGRQDPFYYIPSVVELEKKVRKISSLRLRDFILAISSGATPSVKEEEKYYSNEMEGVPFIRVQNLSPTNELLLKDLRYINRQTHQNYLNRSQIEGGNLLIKITGVGRMAVSSVAPEGFEGNTNQHLVVIKTKDVETSEVLATFLNTDIGEKLASRRATGGTRPALDYSALKSIPIVFEPEIIKAIKKAIVAKRAKEAEAKNLLDGIDAYLLGRLGIETPAEVETKKTFFTRASRLTGGRFDPSYYQPFYVEVEQKLQNSSFNLKKLREVSTKIITGLDSRDFIEVGTPYLRVANIKPLSFDLSDVKFISPIESNKDIQLQKNDLLITRKGSFGNPVIVDESVLGSVISSEVFRIPLKSNVTPQYIAFWLNTKIARTIFDRIKTGGIMGHITQEVLSNFLIPSPPLELQEEIAAHIQSIREQAKALEREAQAEVERAKAEVERLILGKVSADA